MRRDMNVVLEWYGKIIIEGSPILCSLAPLGDSGMSSSHMLGKEFLRQCPRGTIHRFSLSRMRNDSRDDTVKLHRLGCFHASIVDAKRVGIVALFPSPGEVGGLGRPQIFGIDCGGCLGHFYLSLARLFRWSQVRRGLRRSLGLPDGLEDEFHFIESMCEQGGFYGIFLYVSHRAISVPIGARRTSAFGSVGGSWLGHSG
mmetsp:Transcript_87201/g.244076  ORF Transcript_87201/g.244076 Transcript_87201/m.244076 type:complete len:200 (-) Transcript_87201:290-889(-)